MVIFEREGAEPEQGNPIAARRAYRENFASALMLSPPGLPPDQYGKLIFST